MITTINYTTLSYRLGFPDSSVGRIPCNAGDPGSILRLGRSTGERVAYPLQYSWASLVARLVKNPPAMQETWVRTLDWEDPLQKGKAKEPLDESERGEWKIALKLNIRNTEIMAFGPITSWQIDGETVTNFILGGSKITTDGVCSHEIKRHLLLGRKIMTNLAAATAAKSLQSCLTLCDPIDGSLPGSPVPGILQARTLEWVSISFSNAWEWKVKVKSLSCVRLFVTPWTTAYQAPPPMGFSRQDLDTILKAETLLCQQKSV